MNAQDLKNSILQLAIQGKLVEQREEEGTAKELLEKIEVEKKRLIKEGKIKKEKKQLKISEDEVLFDIPESWEWTRMSSIADMYTGNSIPKSIKENKYSKVKNGYDYIGTKDVGFDYTINYDNGIKIPFEEDKFRNSFKDSILMCIEGGSAGRKIGILDKKVCFGNKLCSFNLIYGEPRFLYYYLQSPLFFQAFRAEMTGIIGGVSITKLKGIIVPLPPLEEQKRIVAKIEELMPYVDKYDAAYSEVEELNKTFPKDMQKSILQYAVKGKLVEQREEEGTAEDLYKQIHEEKRQLIKEGKIKKTKKLPEITEDDMPYDIPNSWKWVRLGDLFNVSTGMTPSKSNPLFHENGKIPWITSAQTGEWNIEMAHNFITEYAIENTSLKIYPRHTLLIAMYGQGKTRGQIAELLIDASINQACAALENIIDSDILRAYIKFFQLHNYADSRTGSEGSAQPNLNLNKIRNIIVPLPPYEEQKRIVKKIKVILPYVNHLINS